MSSRLVPSRPVTSTRKEALGLVLLTKGAVASAVVWVLAVVQ